MDVLLPVLVRRPAACQRLVGLAPWRQLVDAFASREPQLIQQMNQKLHRSLAKSLTMAAAGLQDAQTVWQYIVHLLQNVAGELQQLVDMPGLRTAVQQPPVVQRICCLLEGLRGTCRGTLVGQTQPALFDVLSKLLAPLLQLHASCKQQTHIVALILKVW